LPDRTVFITGCSTGIGRSVALLFAQAGYRVVATARKLEAIQDLEEIASREKLTLYITTCDVTSESSLLAAVEFAHSAFGDIHVLVNNAGYGSMGLLEAVPLSEARHQFEVNVFGAMRLIQLIAPDMRKAGWGRIVNVSSIAGRILIPLGGWYSASKFALEALSDAMRMELEPFGVQTVSILPGPVETGFMSNLNIVPPKADFPRFYHELYERLKKRRSERHFEISADKVAYVILRACERRRPKPRYVLTVPARVSSVIRPFFTDRAWDRMIKFFYGVSRISVEQERMDS